MFNNLCGSQNDCYEEILNKLSKQQLQYEKLAESDKYKKIYIENLKSRVKQLEERSTDSVENDVKYRNKKARQKANYIKLVNAVRTAIKKKKL
tara:strand:+ start:420 stop:698 length:279 start_codon:yes stop_codon:yes gene_type:complete